MQPYSVPSNAKQKPISLRVVAPWKEKEHAFLNMQAEYQLVNIIFKLYTNPIELYMEMI